MQPPTLNEIQGVFGLIAILAGVGAALVARLPVGYCAKCGHCTDGRRLEKQERARRREAADRTNHDYWHPTPHSRCTRYGCKKPDPPKDE